MFGIFTYIWLICMVNVGKYTIHGWYGYLDVFPNYFVSAKFFLPRDSPPLFCFHAVGNRKYIPSLKLSNSKSILKIEGWKMSFHLGFGLFSGAMLVSGIVYTYLCSFRTFIKPLELVYSHPSRPHLQQRSIFSHHFPVWIRISVGCCRRSFTMWLNYPVIMGER